MTVKHLRISKLLLISLAIILASLGIASEKEVVSEFFGKVIGISDGDTLTVLLDKQPIKVRLEGIDAPESGQPFGGKAKEALKEFAAGQRVMVKKTGVDKYGRTLGYVTVDGVEANAKMIEEGLAWHYKKYNSEQRYGDLELAARTAKKGLWADEKPIPPWDWRLDQKQTSDSPQKQTAAETKPAQPALKADDEESVTVYVTGTGKKYHGAGCSHLSKSKNAISLAEAKKQGYSACATCGGKATVHKDPAPQVSRDADTATGMTPSGKPIYTGPRGGRYHLSPSGKKVYERKK